MSEFKVVLDGTEVSAEEGMTILEAAEKVEIEIPTLCHRPDLTPFGGCRVCVVEVEGSPKLVASCHTPIKAGMVIRTDTPRVRSARKVALELMLTAHTGPCVTDQEAHACELHNLAAQLEVGLPRFKVRAPRNYPVEEISPYVRRDLSKCILCQRCIRACNEIAKKNIYAMAYRGFQSKVVVDCDVALDKEACKDCGVCIEYCPTSALTKPGKGVV
jgi:NADH dehydrogenase/NADH:ubiquinone oxidoreductase subunit G